MTDRVLIDAALEVAEDYPVFACKADKSPLTKHGFKDATRDPDEIEQQFSHPKAALIGVPTGAASGLVVVDIDTKDDKDGTTWAKAHKGLLTGTRLHRTQSGGTHAVYHLNGYDPGCSNGQVWDGVDIRGTGGYVIWVGSPGYTTLVDADIEPFPVALTEEIRHRHSEWRAQPDEALEQRILTAENFHEAIRDLVYRWVAQGLSDYVIAAKISPLIYASAAADPQHARFETWRSRAADIPRLIKSARDKHKTVIINPTIVPTGHLWADEMVDHPPNLPDWLVDDALGVGLYLLAGSPKIGKSWLVLSLLRAVAGGTPFLGTETTPTECAYYSLEDGPARLARRMRVVSPKFPRVLIRPRFDKPLLDQIKQDHQEHGRRLFILDTLGRKVALTDAYGEVTTALDPIQSYLINNDLCLIGLHHTGKDPFDKDGNVINRGFDRILGSRALQAMCDGMWLLDAHKLALRGRDFEDGDIPLIRQGPVWHEAGSIDSLDRQITEFLDLLDMPVATARLVEEFSQTGERTLKRHLTGLAQKGIITKPSRGLYEGVK